MNSKPTVLLVEDDAILSDAFTIMLSSEGYTVLNAYNGHEALELLKSHRPHIILLDLLMPIMDGKKFLRSYVNEHSIPIIAFSNLDSKDDVSEVLSLGASRYMLKAWATPRQLVRLINDTIRG